MNSRILAVVGALFVVVVGAVVASLLLQQPAPPVAQISDNSGQNSATSSDQPEAEPEAEIKAEAAPGEYVDYTESAIANATGTPILFFHAPWCPQCRSVEADILSTGVPDGITIIKVDYDSNQSLRQLYGVTQQTTFVEVDSSGVGLQSFIASDDPRLTAVLDAMF